MVGGSEYHTLKTVVTKSDITVVAIKGYAKKYLGCQIICLY